MKLCCLFISTTVFSLSLVEANRKLTLLYLANDVIQTGKKKGLEFKVEFSKLLPRALQHMSREKDDSFRKSVERVISVWEERKVFESDAIVRFKSMLGETISRVCSTFGHKSVG